MTFFYKDRIKLSHIICSLVGLQIASLRKFWEQSKKFHNKLCPRLSLFKTVSCLNWRDFQVHLNDFKFKKSLLGGVLSNTETFLGPDQLRLRQSLLYFFKHHDKVWIKLTSTAKCRLKCILVKLFSFSHRNLWYLNRWNI